MHSAVHNDDGICNALLFQKRAAVVPLILLFFFSKSINNLVFKVYFWQQHREIKSGKSNQLHSTF